MSHCFRWAWVGLMLLAWELNSARAQVVFPIGPFVGTYFDNFNNDGPGGAGGHQSVDVFGGFATVQNLTAGGALKIEFSSSLGGNLVTPRSPPLMFGQIGISRWTFDAPISQWGGYWENNSRFDDAVVQFFDVNNNLIGTQTATVPHLGQAWIWNGWESTTPIAAIQVAGNDVEFLNGFIWWEDFQVTVAVPEPTVLALLSAVSLGALGGYFYLKHQRHEGRHQMG
jgi:hypothetical protein